ncbi:TRAP transporter small permease [Salibacterium aidingense]|uniref:TRAP transporter small permease n=1 Tax=Salibacterium aidingense TaxID=384933 RepID=UPI00047DE627|nr:TRAP transporter small permease subunit [Salibacterium aidingense]
MQRIQRIHQLFEKSVETLSVSLFVIGVISTIFGTISRTFPVLPNLSWANELTRFTIIASILLIIGFGIRKGSQISFTLLLEKMSPGPRLILQMINNILMLSLFFIIGYYGYFFAVSNAGQTSSLLEVSMVYPYIFVPIGSLLVMLEVIFLGITQILIYKNEQKNYI